MTLISGYNQTMIRVPTINTHSDVGARPAGCAGLARNLADQYLLRKALAREISHPSQNSANSVLTAPASVNGGGKTANGASGGAPARGGGGRKKLEALTRDEIIAVTSELAAILGETRDYCAAFYISDGREDGQRLRISVEMKGVPISYIELTVGNNCSCKLPLEDRDVDTVLVLSINHKGKYLTDLLRVMPALVSRAIELRGRPLSLSTVNQIIRAHSVPVINDLQNGDIESYGLLNPEAPIGATVSALASKDDTSELIIRDIKPIISVDPTEGLRGQPLPPIGYHLELRRVLKEEVDGIIAEGRSVSPKEFFEMISFEHPVVTETFHDGVMFSGRDEPSLPRRELGRRIGIQPDHTRVQAWENFWCEQGARLGWDRKPRNDGTHSEWNLIKRYAVAAKWDWKKIIGWMKGLVLKDPNNGYMLKMFSEMFDVGMLAGYWSKPRNRKTDSELMDLEKLDITMQSLNYWAGEMAKFAVACPSVGVALRPKQKSHVKSKKSFD